MKAAVMTELQFYHRVAVGMLVTTTLGCLAILAVQGWS